MIIFQAERKERDTLKFSRNPSIFLFLFRWPELFSTSILGHKGKENGIFLDGYMEDPNSIRFLFIGTRENRGRVGNL